MIRTKQTESYLADRMQANKITIFIMRKRGTANACACLTMILTTATLVANPPTQDNKSDSRADRISRKTAELQQEIDSEIEQGSEQLVAGDKKMHAFLKSSGQDKQLEQVKQTEPDSTSNVKQTPAAITDKTETKAQTNTTENKETAAEKPPTTIKIECDGGIYFNNDDGILAYLKNIRLDESDSSFKLRCSDELKVIFDKTPEEKENQPDKEKQKVQPDPKKTDPSTQKDSSFSELGNLNKIIATGNVRIAGVNSDGQPFLASGNEASYNAKTGKMILKGGQPTLQWDANQYLQAQEEGLWITIQMRDKNIDSITTSEGKWMTKAVIKENSPE